MRVTCHSLLAAIRTIGAGGLCALALVLTAPLAARATILFDSVSVSPTSFRLDPQRKAVGLKLVIDGLRLPRLWRDGKRTASVEIVRTGPRSTDVAIALSPDGTGLTLPADRLTTPSDGSPPRLLLTATGDGSAAMAEQMQSLQPARYLLATICTTLADRANLAAMIAAIPESERPPLDMTFQTVLEQLATNCRDTLAEAGTHSDGFISREDAFARIGTGADGLITAEAADLQSWRGNATGPDMSGSIVTFRKVAVLPGDLTLAPILFPEASLLWDGQIGDINSQRTALFGRQSQYSGTTAGLFDGADRISVDLTAATPRPAAFDTAVAGASRESLLLVEHALSNLRLLRVLALETGAPGGITRRGTLTDEGSDHWYMAAFAADITPALEAVRAELFARAFADKSKASELQTALKAWGFYSGQLDGQAGPMTRAAFAAFEGMVSGTANGTPSPREAAALRVPPSPALLIPPLRPATVGDWLTPDPPAEDATSARQQARAEADALLASIAEVEAEIAALEQKTSPRIASVERALEACFCQGGRACP